MIGPPQTQKTVRLRRRCAPQFSSYCSLPCNAFTQPPNFTQGRHKKASLFRTLSKGRARVQTESKSIEVVLFSPSLIFFWTLNGGRGWGDDQVPKVLRHFIFWVFTKVTSRLSKMGRYKSYLTDVQNEKGGGQGPFWTMSKRKTLFYGFPQGVQECMSEEMLQCNFYDFLGISRSQLAMLAKLPGN